MKRKAKVKPRTISTRYGYWEITQSENFVTISDRYLRPKDCRKLSAWLLRAAAYIDSKREGK